MKIVVWADFVDGTRFTSAEQFKARIKRFFLNYMFADSYRLKIDEFTGPVAYAAAMRPIEVVERVDVAGVSGELHVAGSLLDVPNIGLQLALEAAKAGRCLALERPRKFTVQRMRLPGAGHFPESPEADYAREFGLHSGAPGNSRLLPGELHLISVDGIERGLPPATPLLSQWHPATSAELDFLDARGADSELDVWRHLISMLNASESDPEHPDSEHEHQDLSHLEKPVD